MKFLSTSFAQLPFSLYKRDRETYKKKSQFWRTKFSLSLEIL